LVEICFTDHDCACFSQARYGGCVRIRDVREGGASRRGRHSLDIDIVFYRNRDAVKRPPRVADAAYLPRFGERLLFVA
jgi:hypothetical protein